MPVSEDSIFSFGCKFGTEWVKHERLRHLGFDSQITVVTDRDGFKCLQFREDA